MTTKRLIFSSCWAHIKSIHLSCFFPSIWTQTWTSWWMDGRMARMKEPYDDEDQREFDSCRIFSMVFNKTHTLSHSFLWDDLTLGEDLALPPRHLLFGILEFFCLPARDQRIKKIIKIGCSSRRHPEYSSACCPLACLSLSLFSPSVWHFTFWGRIFLLIFSLHYLYASLFHFNSEILIRSSHEILAPSSHSVPHLPGNRLFVWSPPFPTITQKPN